MYELRSQDSSLSFAIFILNNWCVYRYNLCVYLNAYLNIAYILDLPFPPRLPLLSSPSSSLSSFSLQLPLSSMTDSIETLRLSVSCFNSRVTSFSGRPALSTWQPTLCWPEDQGVGLRTSTVLLTSTNVPM